jgi:hypothetical protein
LACSPEGKRLALTGRGTSSNPRPEIWDVTDPDTPTRRSYMPEPSVTLGSNALEFTPGGRALAVARGGKGVDL